MPIELGFARAPSAEEGIPILSASWCDWDGGKLGGLPRWLCARSAPTPAAAACGVCGDPPLLLLQVYAPVDSEDVGHGDAFHRALYVFYCGRGSCSGAGAAGAARGVARAWRSQLPRDNGGVLPPQGDVPISRRSAAPLCALCGGAAPHQCARCKGARYCGKAHQLAHWKAGGHRAACGGGGDSGGGGGGGGDDDDAVRLATALRCGAALREWEVVIEDEPDSAAREALLEAGLPEEAARAVRAMRSGGGGGGGDGAAAAAAAEGEGAEALPSIAQLSQAQLHEALGTGAGAAAAADPVLCDFEARVAAAPAQVVRYSTTWPHVDANGVPPRAPGGGGGGDGGGDDGEGDEDGADDASGAAPGAPLWFSSEHRPAPHDIPPCAWCGAARVFELQVMPQTLHFALPEGGDTLAGGMDFGTLCVYTCPKSCALEDGARCVEECVWVQPP
jgi:hypothetical protein